MDKSPLQQSLATLTNIRVHRDDRDILNIPNLQLHRSKITAIVGPNGSGKTTFLKILHGLLESESGIVNRELSSALVLHHTPLIKGSTFLNLKLLKDVSSSLNDFQITQALEDVGLLPLKNQVATKLSAGERQRLCLARAKLQNSQLVLLDEPTANLDPNATDHIESLIQDMANEGTHFIIATHDLAQVKRLSQSVLLLVNGVVAEYTDTRSFFETPSSQITKSFIARELGWQK